MLSASRRIKQDDATAARRRRVVGCWKIDAASDEGVDVD
jgi:hypothetical protein